MELDLIREFTGRDGMRMTWYVWEDSIRRRIPYLAKVRFGKADNEAWAATQRAMTLNRGR